LSLLAAGSPVEAAFREAFQTDFATLESELRAYVRLARYPVQLKSLDRPAALDSEIESAPMTEPEVLAVLGDLLLHTDQPEAAEDYLRRSIALAPDADASHTSLGILRLRQNRFAEAEEHLRRAVSANAENYLAHYAHADALARGASEADATVAGFERKTALVRAGLRRAIELAPRFLEAYRLLVQVELERGTRMDEATATLEHALSIAPRRQELRLLLAQIHLRRDEPAAARAVLDAVIGAAPDSHIRTTAQTILKTVAAREELLARLKREQDIALPDALPSKPVQPCDMPEPGPQRKRLRFEGEQVCGLLKQVECETEGVVLSVAVGERTLRLQSQTLNRIRFVTYTTEVRGHLTCGMREPANPVLVTFRLPKNFPAGHDGEVIAVEFIPRDWGR
jgi:tetratricopeptide (TPR) repeat protein